MLQNVFIVKKDSNELIFYGQLTEEPVEDLETVLSQIITKAVSESPGAKKVMALNQGKFMYGVFQKFYMILHLEKGTSKSKANELVDKLASTFKKKYNRQLLQYAGDNSIFAGFSKDVQEALAQKEDIEPENVPKPVSKPSTSPSLKPVNSKKLKGPSPPKLSSSSAKKSIPRSPSAPTSATQNSTPSKSQSSSSVDDSIPLSQRKGIITLKKATGVSDDFSTEKPLLQPSTDRDAYPDGIPDYARDEIMFNESFDVQKNFECELVDYNVSVIDVRLNISPQHIYTIRIDFTNYPEIPEITLPKSLENDLPKSINEISYFLRNWDPKIPPHITEIIYELEKLFIRFKSKGVLTPNQDMPDYILPDLKPLEGDITYNPDSAPAKDVDIPEYDGSALTDKYKSESGSGMSQPQKPQQSAPNQATGQIKRQRPSPQHQKRQKPSAQSKKSKKKRKKRKKRRRKKKK